MSELEDVLARLPADMPVLVGSAHIERIFLEARDRHGQRIVRETRCETGRCATGFECEEFEKPQHIELWAGGGWGQGTRLTDEDHPPVTLIGKRLKWARFGKRLRGDV